MGPASSFHLLFFRSGAKVHLTIRVRSAPANYVVAFSPC
jgi:hypothetical protein